MTEKSKVTIFVRNIDKGLWQKFRAQCIIEGKSLKQKLEAIIKETIKE